MFWILKLFWIDVDFLGNLRIMSKRPLLRHGHLFDGPAQVEKAIAEPHSGAHRIHFACSLEPAYFIQLSSAILACLANLRSLEKVAARFILQDQ